MARCVSFLMRMMIALSVLLTVGFSFGVTTLAGNAKAHYRIDTVYVSATSCSGPIKSIVVLMADKCVLYQTGTWMKRIATLSADGTSVAFTRLTFSDAGCTVQSGVGPASDGSDSGLTWGYKCTVSGGVATSRAYTTDRKLDFGGVGLVWKGYSTASSCSTRKGGFSFANYTAFETCQPWGKYYATFGCNAGGMETILWRDQKCSKKHSTTQKSFTTINSASCATPKTALMDGIGSDRYMRAECHETYSPNDVRLPFSATAQDMSGLGANVVRLYYDDKHCGSAPFSYRIEPLVLNGCNPPSVKDNEASPYLLKCAQNQNKYSITKSTYGETDKYCVGSPTNQKTLYQAATCGRDLVSEHKSSYHIQTICGAIPPSVANADQLLVKQYADSKCSFESATRSTLLGVCHPVLAPPPISVTQESALGPPQVLFYRKVLYEPPKSNAWAAPVLVKETRFAKEDSECAGFAQSSQIIPYATQKLCVPDPLYPGFFVDRVKRLVGLSPATVPEWIVSRVGVPLVKPTTKPTARPTPTPRPTWHVYTNTVTNVAWPYGGQSLRLTADDAGTVWFCNPDWAAWAGQKSFNRIDGYTRDITLHGPTMSQNGATQFAPTVLAVTPAGDVLYGGTSDNRVFKMVIATEQITYLATGTTFSDGTLRSLTGICLDRQGNIFLIDKFAATAAGVVKRIDASTGAVTNIAQNAWNWAGSNMRGIAVNANGRLFIAFWNGNAVRSFDPASTESPTSHICSVCSGGGWSEALDVAVDGANNVYVAANLNNGIFKIDGQTGAVTAFGTTGSPAFSNPYAVAANSNGVVWALNYGHNYIQKIT